MKPEVGLPSETNNKPKSEQLLDLLDERGVLSRISIIKTLLPEGLDPVHLNKRFSSLIAVSRERAAKDGQQVFNLYGSYVKARDETEAIAKLMAYQGEEETQEPQGKPVTLQVDIAPKNKTELTPERRRELLI